MQRWPGLKWVPIHNKEIDSFHWMFEHIMCRQSVGIQKGSLNQIEWQNEVVVIVKQSVDAELKITKVADWLLIVMFFVLKSYINYNILACVIVYWWESTGLARFDFIVATYLDAATLFSHWWGLFCNHSFSSSIVWSCAYFWHFQWSRGDEMKIKAPVCACCDHFLPGEGTVWFHLIPSLLLLQQRNNPRHMRHSL